jgi:sulfur-carrier protein
MKIQVRYFASLREAIGTGQALHSVPHEVASVGALREWLIQQDATHADALALGKAVRAAVNQLMCDEAAPLKEGDEVAFFPPVTGG